MAVELEQVKDYLRIDGAEDDAILGLLIGAAGEFLSNAGVEESESKLYAIAVMLLVSHWYENRESVLVGSISKAMEYSLQSIILQLK